MTACEPFFTSERVGFEPAKSAQVQVQKHKCKNPRRLAFLQASLTRSKKLSCHSANNENIVASLLDERLF